MNAKTKLIHQGTDLLDRGFKLFLSSGYGDGECDEAIRVYHDSIEPPIRSVDQLTETVLRKTVTSRSVKHPRIGVYQHNAVILGESYFQCRESELAALAAILRSRRVDSFIVELIIHLVNKTNIIPLNASALIEMNQRINRRQTDADY